jgi:uncharacterized protein (DUF111 family)
MLLMTTIDDLPAEGLPYVIERTMEEGANNVHVLNAITKKGRMEYIVLVDINEDRMEDVCSLLALEFGTLGIKTFEYKHVTFPFEIETKMVTIKAKDIELESNVKVKYLKKDGKEVLSLKAEYEDIKPIAQELKSKGLKMSLLKLKTIIEAEAYKSVLKEKNVTINVDEK